MYGIVPYKEFLIKHNVCTVNPLIQVASIRGRTIGGPVQPLIVGKILNPSKLPYLDHFELFEVKNLALELIFIEKPLIQV